MIKDYFIYSVRNLRNRGLRSWLTMLGIFIGIAAVVSLIGLGEGLRIAIMSQFGFLGPDILSVQASGLAFAGPPGTGVVNPLNDDLAGKIEKLNGIETSFNRYLESVQVEFNDKQVLAIAASVPQGEKRKIFEDMVNLKVKEGRILKDGDSKKVLLGNNYRKDDMFGKGVKAGDKILIKGISFEVAGILEKKGSFIFDDNILMNEQAIIDVLGAKKEEVDIVAVKVLDLDRINEIKQNIEKLLRKERNVKKGEENFQVQSPQQIVAALNSRVIVGVIMRRFLSKTYSMNAVSISSRRSNSHLSAPSPVND